MMGEPERRSGSGDAPALAVEGLTVRVGARVALAEVGFTLPRGALVGLIGPNGAGKSTLLKALVGRVAAHGAIAFGGRPAARLGPIDRARALAYLPQEREIGWPIAVEAVVALGRQPHRAAGGFGGRAPADPAARERAARDRAAIDRALERMDLLALRGRPATALSGGERARVLIARTLAQDAPLLLADEPTAGLDPAHQIALMQVFAALAAEGRTVLVSLHDLGLAARWCDRLLALDQGRLVADGPPDAVLTPEFLARVYGVRAYRARCEGATVLAPIGPAEAGQ